MNLDTIESMRELLTLYSECKSSSTILESIGADDNFNAKMANIKDNMLIPKDELPNYVPMLTPSEIIDMHIDDGMTDKEKEWLDNYSRTCMLGAGDSMQYKNDVVEAYSLWEVSMDERKLLNLGWIPGVQPTIEAFKSARDRLYEYVLENTVRLIDLSNTTNNIIVSEDAKTYKGNLVPVYLVAVYTGTTMSNITTSYTSSKYGHAAIGFDPKLDKLYSYSMNAKSLGGLSFESLKGYSDYNPAAKIFVQCIFVTKKQYEKIRGNIDWYIANWKNSRYSIGNLFNIVANKTKNTNHNLSMICSQFVDSLLKLVNIDLTNKPSNLVTPANLVEVKNPTVYKLYEGDAKGYDYKKIQSMVDKLSNNAEPGRSTVYESAKSMYTDETVLEIYRAIDMMLTAKCIFEEAIPFQVEDNGDFTINTYKNYELKYQEIHTLLKTVNNTESLKDEMCKLWCLECKLEKKIQTAKIKKKRKDSNEVLEEYYKLRSRILNDFNKYMKQILKDEPDFNFSEYYRNSPYYDGTKVIKRNTLKGFGKLIQSVITPVK